MRKFADTVAPGIRRVNQRRRPAHDELEAPGENHLRKTVEHVRVNAAGFLEERP